MTFRRLFLENLLFHWRGNLAVLLGAAVGTAVLTGALLVGDSLRGSLRDLTLQRLGWIDYALVSNRFFGPQVAAHLPAERVSSAIVLQGAASAGDADKSLRRAGRVLILGVNSNFWPGTPPGGAGFWGSQKKEVILNRALADDLAVKPGDSITLHLRKASAVPRETLLGRRDASEVVS